ncbi:MAG: PspA/IM30 family protein, partial [Lachnospiraceae bacterium]|nr:PspA/IM30 family protein [Lachnospiraceae bacterium]
HDKLTMDIKELETRKETIKGKLAVAKAQEKINKMTSSVSSANNSIASFERYEALANKKLDKAQAEAELNASNPTNSIRDLTAKYVNDPNVDAELAALKASLGMTAEVELPQ